MAGARLIDLSLPISASAPEPRPPRVRSIDHRTGAGKWGRVIAWPPGAPIRQKLASLWGYLLGTRRMTRQDFPGQMFLNNDIVTASVHCGTHMDAPYHFGPTSAGELARRIGDVPLDWCFGPGVMLDVSYRRPGEEISAADLKSALDAWEYDLQPGDVVLVRTGADRLWPSPAYFRAFPGMSAEATNWLLDQGIRTIGTDAPGFDRPIGLMVQDYLADRHPEVLWPSHFLGRQREYVHLERLARLDELPAPGCFTVACFPVVVEGAGAGWTRAVAIVDNGGT